MAARPVAQQKMEEQRRLREKYGEPKPLPRGENQELDGKRLQAAVGDRLFRALHYLDDYKLATAPANQLAVVIGILAEKRQLLRGEPTQILSHEQRRKLDDLAPALLEECRRRGIELTLDRDKGEYQEVKKVTNDG